MFAEITLNDCSTKTKKCWKILYHKNYLINNNIQVTTIINNDIRNA